MNAYRQMLDKLKADYYILVGAKAKLENDNDKHQVQIDSLNDKIVLESQVSTLLNITAKTAREKAKEYIEQVVTNALKYISGSDYTFEIDIQELRGKPDAEFYVVTTINGHKSRQKPQDACGGGFVDIISTALRYAYLQLFNNPSIGGFICLDEPGKMISEQASVKFAEFVKQLSDSFNRQTIMITHNENLSAVAVNTNIVSMRNDKSEVQQLSTLTIQEDEI